MTASAQQPQTLATEVAQVFERIHREQMAGLPLLNPALLVATLGFQAWQGRTLGMLVTPWTMGVLLFPGADDAWETLALGHKQTFDFPGGSRRFMVNVVEGLGVCQMHSVHSPMRAFHSQAAALAEATRQLDRLMTAPTEGDRPKTDPVDEELLGRILRGEKVPALIESPHDGAITEGAAD